MKKICLLPLVLLLLVGCSTSLKEVRKLSNEKLCNNSYYIYYPPHELGVKVLIERDKISYVYKNDYLKGNIYPGMNKCEVKVSWGKPERINRSVSINGATEQWVYSQGHYVYFKNGEVVRIQDSQKY